MGAIRRLWPSAPTFPARLAELADPPSFVDVRGQLPRSVPAVAIVGARRASEAGRDIAHALGRAAAEAGLWVISGGAVGIDAAAHNGALVGAGQTLAVLGTPLSSPGPRTNRRLFEAILDGGGGWLSECDAPPDRLAFCRRNRMIAALADWVVVIEGHERSGTRYTLRAARQLGRRLAAVTWAPGDPRGAQAAWVFARQGVPVWSADALLAHVGRRRRRRGRTGARTPDLRGLDQAVTVEGFAALHGLSVAEALARLTELELEGRVTSESGGRFRPR